MCGIFAYIDRSTKQLILDTLRSHFDKIKHRGPDSQTLMSIYEFENLLTVIFGFHRLAIMGLDKISDQPLYHPENDKIIVICNGEIYNFRELRDQYKFNYRSNSDCEIIVHLYERFGIEKTVELLDGVFAFVLLDKRDPLHPLMIAGRDPIGVRPLFIATDEHDAVVGFSSELKSLDQLAHDVRQFLPGHYQIIDLISQESQITKYYDFNQTFGQRFSESTVITDLELATTNSLLTSAVEKQMMSDRPLGLFISGGLDSSLIAAIATRHSSSQLHSFAIGLEGYQSSDLHYARKVADFLKTEHHEVKFTTQKGLDALRSVIWHLESYDVTTIRASTPMYLLSQWIMENTDIRVILTGEAPDESIGGYLYFHNAPSLEEFQTETEERVSDLHLYDLLRGDRATAAWSLEVRVPYLDKKYLNYMINLPPQLKHPKYNQNIEKYILRKSFDNEQDPYLPSDVLWRPKEAFSDGVGYSWKDSIIKYSEQQISDDLFSQRSVLYPINTPMTKEAFLYRQIFESFYPGRHHVIPRFWMPKWVGNNVTDPSATVLKVHSDRIPESH